MNVKFSFWSNSICNLHTYNYFCKPHTQNVAFNEINLSVCLASFTFETIQWGINIIFINHTRNLRSLIRWVYTHVSWFWFSNKSIGNSYNQCNMFFFSKFWKIYQTIINVFDLFVRICKKQKGQHKCTDGVLNKIYVLLNG